ncbi:MAG: type II toxin-antitoxin system RelE/ParE family toxin [Verrucomicrobia bacterium]|nr:type II toxin-antitoxin system RelE/ParE family toxin [Verrucomicrobiota bacterium]
MKRLTYLSIAEIELAEAAEFYDERQPGLGRLFLDAVRESGERICQHPEWWPVFERPVRGCRVAPFPYRLLYRELPNHIQIISIFHLSRRPQSWRDRLS